MKRILCALLAVLMLFSLTACTQSGGGVDVDPTVEGYFHIPVTGEYGDGILLPDLNDAPVTVMMSIAWPGCVLFS